MNRSLHDVVDPHFPSRVPPQRFPADVPRNGRDVLRMVEGLRPTSGNLAPQESWRRLLGGRKRYNHQRQQIAAARRDAIFVWLLRHRRVYWSELTGPVPVERIIIQHGDCTMLARALDVGKSTICRDLSAIQAVHPVCFGQTRVSSSYAEHMHFWRYAHRTHLGEEQPHHNLRFPKNQHGPEARVRRDVRKTIGHDVYDASRSETPEAKPAAERDHGARQENSIPDVDDFLTLLEQNCPAETLQRRPARRARKVPRGASV